jgi:hypothetical protein
VLNHVELDYYVVRIDIWISWSEVKIDVD